MKIRTMIWSFFQSLTVYLSAESISLIWRMIPVVGEGTAMNMIGGDDTGVLLLWQRA